MEILVVGSVAYDTIETAVEKRERQLGGSACYFALAGDKAHALSWLGRAIRMESSLRELVPDETDCDQLRQESDFQMLVGEKEDESSSAV